MAFLMNKCFQMTSLLFALFQRGYIIIQVRNTADHLNQAYKPCVFGAIGFSWDCSNDTVLVSLEEMSFTDPPWWP